MKGTNPREVYSEDTVLYPKDRPLSLPSNTVIRSRIRIIVTDESVRQVRSYMRTGLNSRTRNRWFKWQTEGMIGIYRTKQGKFTLRDMTTADGKRGRLYFLSDNPWHWQRLFNETVRHEEDIRMRNEANKLFGEITLNRVYPLASHWGIDEFERIPRGIPALKEDNIQDFIYRMFGKRAYRKDLVKAVGNNANLRIIALAACFRPYVPIDWIINFLRINAMRIQAPGRVDFNPTKLTDRIKSTDPRSFRHLLNQQLDGNDLMGIDDMLRGPILRPMEVGLVRTWREWHDEIWGPRGGYRQHLVRPFDPEDSIPITPVGKKLQVQEPPFKLQVAQKARDLYEWSELMGNCIRGYVHEVMKDKSPMTLGAMLQGDKVIGNFEIRNNELRQMLGKHNQILPDDERRIFEKLFTQAGVFVGDYWGNPVQVTEDEALDYAFRNF